MDWIGNDHGISCMGVATLLMITMLGLLTSSRKTSNRYYNRTCFLFLPSSFVIVNTRTKKLVYTNMMDLMWGRKHNEMGTLLEKTMNERYHALFCMLFSCSSLHNYLHLWFMPRCLWMLLEMQLLVVLVD